MNIYKLVTLVVVSILAAIVAGSAANSVTHIADQALAAGDPQGSAERLSEAARAPGSLYLPVILLNTPAVGCVTGTNGIAVNGVVGSPVCANNITLSLTAPWSVSGAALNTNAVVTVTNTAPGYAILAQASGSYDGIGVYATGFTGLYGESTSTNGNGIYGGASNGPSAWGVWAQSYSGDAIYADSGKNVNGPPWAGYFEGPITAKGYVTHAAAGMRIDDPLDPTGKYLYHSAVESPDMKDLYDGVVTLDANGEAIVQLPAWFEALNRDFRYQLTTIGGYAQVYIASEVQGGRFKISGGKAGLKVSWQVTGIRHDVFAEENRMPVEQVKPEGAAGKYLHPKLFGQPETMGETTVKPH